MERVSAQRDVDRGVLVLRVGLGILFMAVHGGPKLLGGPELWARVGMAMGHLGISFAPAFWGFLAACSEFFGGLCLVLGVGVRPAAAFLAMTMMVATTMHLAQGDGLQVASHAMEDGVVFVSLLFLGAGRYTLARWLRPDR
jgi:putative oxidoreductase